MATKEEDAREAWGAITRMFIADENQRRFASIAATEGISPRQLHAVLDMVPGQPQPMRDLAQAWYCDASNVTAIVDQLEEQGLAERQASGADRRVKLVALTERGAALRARATERLQTPATGLLKLTGPELRTLRELLVKAAAGYGWPGGSAAFE